MSRAQVQKEREKAWLAILLAWVAGSVDVIGYLMLFHLFTAHMSGNSVATGAYLGRHQWGAALYRAFPIPLFVIGVALGATITETAARRGIRSTFSISLGLEAVLLFLFMAYGSRLDHNGPMQLNVTWKFYPLAAFPIVAMGLQNATLRRVGNRTVHTTYVTGILTNLAEQGVAYMFWLYDHMIGRTINRMIKSLRVSTRQKSLSRVILYGGIWSGYIIGAILGGYIQQRWELKALALPLCGLVFIIIWDLIRPIHTPPGFEQEGSRYRCRDNDEFEAL